MDVYLNDISFICDNDIRDEWGKIKIFNELLKELASTFNASIVARKDIWSISICNYNIVTKINTKGTSISSEQHRYLHEIFKKFISRTDGKPLFSLDEDMNNCSSSVGKAAEEGRLVISFTFDDRFKNDAINGWLMLKDSLPIKSYVDNLYDKRRTDNFKYLADISKCNKLNPIESPMWNVDVARMTLQNVDFINVSQKERMSKLISYGKIIAEINGWTYNDKISKLNTTNDHIRYIFDSGTNFTNYPKAYLCIDLEGPEVCYELCDKKGHHKGEISWDGKQKEEKKNHGIEV
ncbi:MAG: hypothetical protein MJZ41_00290 [Bacteroidaceae bacterium]|nr:hypothetical protein [Bacteroidaceae bacterium]